MLRQATMNSDPSLASYLSPNNPLPERLRPALNACVSRLQARISSLDKQQATVDQRISDRTAQILAIQNEVSDLSRDRRRLQEETADPPGGQKAMRRNPVPTVPHSTRSYCFDPGFHFSNAGWPTPRSHREASSQELATRIQDLEVNGLFFPWHGVRIGQTECVTGELDDCIQYPALHANPCLVVLARRKGHLRSARHTCHPTM
jgi:hypothetical protein